MKSFAQETHPRRLRLLLPLVAFAILLLMVAALGAGAAPAPKKPAAPPHPAAPPAPPEPQHTTLDFQEENQDSAAPESDDASRSTSDYWIKRHAGNDDLVRFGENVTVPAGRTVMGDVVVVGGNVDVYGNVNGDAVAVGGSVRVHPGGSLRGQAITIGGAVLNDTGRGLHGPSVSLPSVTTWLSELSVLNAVGQGIQLIKILFSILLAAAFAWVANAVAAERSERAVAFIRLHPGTSFLWGLGALIGLVPSAFAVVILGIILVITLIGIPVAILLIAAYAVALILLIIWGSLVGMTIVGRWAWKRLRPLEAEPALLKAMLVGIVTLAMPNIFGHLLRALAFLVPPAGALGIAIWVLGCLLSLAFWLVGIGALIATRAGMPPRFVPAVARPGAMPPAGGMPTMPPPPPPAAPGIEPTAPPPATA
ncbi:MAG TPA: hypothetical protein VKF80_01110 [Candidatus Eisenbacteria bacterium]|nr:hypothetical protein [Candidatus Eisenbacteria bacterium]